jgi:hypothetical protein
MLTDEEAAHVILGIFARYKVIVGGTLRRNHFIDVRDADFQRGLTYAVGRHWLKVNPRDRYTYVLTDTGLAAGLRADLKPVPHRAPST